MLDDLPEAVAVVVEPRLIQVTQSLKWSHVRISYPVVVEPRLIQVQKSIKCSHVRISYPVVVQPRLKRLVVVVQPRLRVMGFSEFLEIL